MKYRGPRHKYSFLSRALALVTAVSPGLTVGGCSLLFVEGPPPQHVDIRDSSCTTSNAWPVVDTLVGGFQLFRVMYATSRTDADYGSEGGRDADIFLGATMLILFAISAGVGYSRVDKCKEAVGWYRSGGAAPRVPTYHRRPSSPGTPPPPNWGTAPSPYGQPPAAATPPGATPSPQQPATGGYPPAPSAPAPVSPPVPAPPPGPPVPQQVDPE